jgi:hypothetical protein
MELPEVNGQVIRVRTVYTRMYQWDAGFMANMNAMFQDGRLIQKAQFGLR